MTLQVPESRTCSHVVERNPCCTRATRTCTDALPCATSGDLICGGETSVRSSLGTKCPGGTSQIEPSSKRATATRNGAEKVCLVPTPARAGGLSGRSRHLLSFDLENGWEPAYRPRSRRGSGGARHGAHCRERGRRRWDGLGMTVK
jgi:hypothetical protein